MGGEARQNETGGLIPHPAVARWRTEGATLRAELAEARAELDRLKTVELPRLARLYQLKLGHLEYQSYSLELGQRELKRRIELAQSARNRAETISQQEIEEQIAREFSAWRKQCEQMRADSGAADTTRQTAAPLSGPERQELQNLYRRLARLCHPDAAPAGDTRAASLWLRVAAAYREGDLSRLRQLSLTGEAAPDALNSMTLGELRYYCRRLRGSLAEARHEIAEIQASPGYRLGELLSDPAFVARRAAGLRRQITWLREYEEQLLTLWRSLRDACPVRPAPPPQPPATTDPDWPDVIFTENDEP